MRTHVSIAQYFLTACLFGLVFAVFAAQLAAQPPKNKAKPKTNSAAPQAVKKAPPPITPKVQRQLMQFVGKHHAELRPVLQHLRRTRPEQFQTAMNQIKRSYDRLEQFKKRDPQRHEIELKAWQIKSRIQFLTAKLSINEKDELVSQLERAIRDDYDIRKQRLELDRQRTNDRLARIDRQIAEIDSVDQQKIDLLIQNRLKKIKAAKRRRDKADEQKRDRKGKAKNQKSDKVRDADQKRDK